MNRYGYYLEALQNGAYKYREWVNRTFAVSRLPGVVPSDQVKYPYQLFAVDDRYAFYRNGETELTFIENAVLTEPLIISSEPIELKAGDCPNLDKDIVTSCGNLLFNFNVIVYAFGKKLPYMDGKVNLGALEKKLAKIVVDDLPDVGMEEDSVIYVRHLRRYIKAAGQLAGYSHLFVPAATPFTVRAAPGYKELRESMMLEYKDRLNDPTVVSKIGEALEKLDREWIASDPDEGFYVKEKQFASNRKKMLYMHGIEHDFDGSGGITFIPGALNEGWEIKRLPEMANSTRDGSHSRGALTALGGEETKNIFRAMGGSIVSEDSCTTVRGVPMVITEGNHSQFIGNQFKVKPTDDWVAITEENSARYIGLRVQLRTPGYCTTSGFNYCRACMGEFIRGKENVIANECAVTGNQMLSMFLAAFHAKALKTTKYDITMELS